ncbi:hypothetical protein [Pseudomonas alabamensis]|uniref:hypothetical protein n=1 Tax=Pseudomonas alabamensis TaxID=3064349 RepID=UPI0011A8A23A
MQQVSIAEAVRMQTDYERPLIAYAYLAQTGAQNDILTGLVPLIAPIAKESSGKYFERDHLSQELKKLYGVDVHPWALEELIPRMEKAEIISKTSNSRSGAIYKYNEKTDDQETTITETDIENILEDFINYSKEIVQQSRIDISEELLRKHFFNQIATADFQINLLRPGTNSQKSSRLLQLRPTEDGDRGCNSAREETLPNPKPSYTQVEQMKIISAAYIMHTSVDKQDIYKQLLNIATGAILAEYILNLREPNSSFTLQSLRLYLDAPLVMSYLDLNEELVSAHTRLLIDSLRDKGASLYIFKPHVDEFRDNLRSATTQDGTGIRRPTHRRMSSAAFRSQVQLILTDVEGYFKSKQIYVIPIPKTLSYFSDEQLENLTRDLGSYSYHARERDALAVAGVMRFRAAKINSRNYFHECQHIFLTENEKVASASFDFVISNMDYKESYTPPAVTGRYMAGLIFVLYGSSTSTELTHQKLLANCASALEPNHFLLSKVTSFLREASGDKADSFVEMMTSLRSSQHRAIYLLNQAPIIDSLADAERAFIDFETEIRESVALKHLEKEKEQALFHKQQIDAMKDSQRQSDIKHKESQDKLFKELKSKEEAIELSKESIEEINSELALKNEEIHALKEQQHQRDEEASNREIEDLQDLLSKSINFETKRTQNISKLVIFIGFSLTAATNLWGLNVGKSLLFQILCALALVGVPILFAKIASRILTKNTAVRNQRKFNELLKERRTLARISANYDINFSTGIVSKIDSSTPPPL